MRIRYSHTSKEAWVGVSKHLSYIHTHRCGHSVNAGHLLLDLQGVHVVVALGCVLLRVGLGIDQNVVFIPGKHIEHRQQSLLHLRKLVGFRLEQ